MKKLIRYLFIIMFIFFLGILPVNASEECTSVTTEIDNYNTYVKLLNSIDCTDNADESNVATCNEFNVRKNLAVTKIMKVNDEKNVCKNEKSKVNKIIKENKDNCGKIFDDDFSDFVNKVMVFFYILGPILLILFGSLDYAKATVSSEANALKKANTRFAKRLAATLLLFLTPTIVNFFVGINVSDKYLSGNAYTCGYKYLVYNKKYTITYVPINNSSTTSKSSSATVTRRNGNYILYRQGDSPWGSETLICGSTTLSSAGCAVTAVSMQIVNSGVVNEKSFSPSTLNSFLKKNACVAGDNIAWGSVSMGTNGTFKIYNQVSISGNLASKAKELSTYLSQGYYPVIQVKSCQSGGTHYVAVFEVQGSDLLVGDPADGELKLLSTSGYPIASGTCSTQTILYQVEK